MSEPHAEASPSVEEDAEEFEAAPDVSVVLDAAAAVVEAPVDGVETRASNETEDNIADPLYGEPSTGNATTDGLTTSTHLNADESVQPFSHPPIPNPLRGVTPDVITSRSDDTEVERIANRLNRALGGMNDSVTPARERVDTPGSYVDWSDGSRYGESAGMAGVGSRPITYASKYRTKTPSRFLRWQDTNRPGSSVSLNSYGVASAADSGQNGDPTMDVAMTREYLVTALRESIAERDQLTVEHATAEARLVEHFKTQQVDDLLGTIERTGTEQERVVKTLQELDFLNEELKNIQSYYDATVQEMKQRLEEKEFKATEVKEAFTLFKREIAKTAEHTKTGRCISLRQVESFESEEAMKDEELERTRLKNINLRKQYNTLEKLLRHKEELKNGLHLIDFEQLKIENQTFTEKIEERNEELQKLRRKITNTVHVLTHIKEKLQYTQTQSLGLRGRLHDLEDQVVRGRDLLAQRKHARDLLRQENNELKQRSGLIGSNDLLKDFENKRNELVVAKKRMEELKAIHQKLIEKTMSSSVLRATTA
ncbi:hypothetical protein PROFUN_11651 [Planoprotostelium fungivorum]|uniref:CCDC113/CCDC96 coiled-coil domain-containing protein n=1 Tax=Planoprotostelium fungivorum TaxID=1890364 RepID=A0A2P6N9S0_9EUKA|nr:hypothetical protein PROFUN_11651 [Planoprotostelium fungivorum]